MQLEVLVLAIFVVSAFLVTLALTCGDELSEFSPRAALRGLRGVARRGGEPAVAGLDQMFALETDREEAEAHVAAVTDEVESAAREEAARVAADRREKAEAARAARAERRAVKRARKLAEAEATTRAAAESAEAARLARLDADQRAEEEFDLASAEVVDAEIVDDLEDLATPEFSRA